MPEISASRSVWAETSRSGSCDADNPAVNSGRSAANNNPANRTTRVGKDDLRGIKSGEELSGK